MPRRLLPGMRIVQLGVPSEDGATEARWAEAEVLVKDNSAHANVVVNEFLANRLAVAVGVPVPMGDLWIDDTGRPHWVIAAIKDRGFDLPPPSETEMALVPEATRGLMVAFDAWILNPDRHESNVLADGAGHAWLIDHDQALLGEMAAEARVDGLRTLHERPHRDTGGVWAGSARPERAAVTAGALRIRSAPSAVLERAASEARRVGLLDAPAAAAVTAMLSARRENLSRLLDPSTMAPTVMSLEGVLEVPGGGD